MKVTIKYPEDGQEVSTRECVVEIPEVTSQDAPVALSTLIRLSNQADPHRILNIRWYKGSFWTKNKFSRKFEVLDHADFHIPAIPDVLDLTNPEHEKIGVEYCIFKPIGMYENAEKDYREMLEKSTLIIDGVFYREMSEPVYQTEVIKALGKKQIICRSVVNVDATGVLFNLNARDDALKAAVALAKKRKELEIPVISGPDWKVLMPEVLFHGKNILRECDHLIKSSSNGGAYSW